jgi:3',5'-cyclic AMP phosphodiesterase CpdA
MYESGRARLSLDDMVKLLHISDLHFGRRRARALSEAVLRTEAELRPDAVVCSGDLVEWSEINGPWHEVRTFLRRFTAPLVVTPGNHDIERFNPINRLLHPLARYRRFIEREVDSVTELPGAVIVGLGTPRWWSFDLGHISRRQIELARRAFANVKQGILKVVTLHHGIGHERGAVRREAVWGSGRLRRALLEMGAQLVLSGHAHVPRAERIEGQGSALVWAQAGTMGSHRYRSGLGRNSLSVVHATAERVVIEWWHYVERLGRFAPESQVALALPERVPL